MELKNSETTGIPPPSKWGQNNSVIFLTINIECKEPKIEFTEDSLKFSGIGLPENKFYDVNIKFFGQIKADAVEQKNTLRCIEFTIPKAVWGNWNNLTADNKKCHWLKVDFDKTALDSDSEDEGGKEGGNNSIDQLLKGLGSVGVGDQKPSFDVAEEDEDSDDEELPGLY